MRKRLLYLLAVALAGAGFAHVAVVLLLPAVAVGQAWERLGRSLPPDAAMRENLPLFAPDPFFRTAACRFDLGNGAIRLHTAGAVAAWFLSVYARDGRNLATIGDRSQPGGALDVLLLPPQDPVVPGTFPPGVELEAGELVAVLQVFEPDSSWSAATNAFLASAACSPAKPVQ